MSRLFRTRTAQQVVQQAAPAAPEPEAPPPKPVMPMPDDEAVKIARKRSIASQRSRKGRLSTIFTSEQDLLGG